ncbi:MAG TPA: hypothetical protein VIY27_12515 [Myxococcota bacterium]
MANPDYYKVIITNDGARVTLRAPFHGDMSQRARAIGGTWDREGRLWAFPAAAEPQVRDLCVLLFKTDDGDVAKDLDRRSTQERTLGEAGRKRERKGRKRKPGSLGDERMEQLHNLAAYSTDDLLAELRRRGVVPALPGDDRGERPRESPGKKWPKDKPLDAPRQSGAERVADTGDAFTLD